ncbi:MAG: hypothetical protein JSV31_04160 [Desulfobacterales bacterium]|nr:MAG: hypothetical protein JSV31_04160 [Desulfobacterales bacterium]
MNEYSAGSENIKHRPIPFEFYFGKYFVAKVKFLLLGRVKNTIYEQQQLSGSIGVADFASLLRRSD